jgi:hypothetical protein
MQNKIYFGGFSFNFGQFTGKTDQWKTDFCLGLAADSHAGAVSNVPKTLETVHFI